MSNITTEHNIAWIIPCYNEEATIGLVLDDIKKHAPHTKIYVIDNNSSDKTYEIAAAAGAHVLREKRQGKGYVISRIFEMIDADIYIMIDGDATYSVTDWSKLIKPIIDREADMVVGSRLKTSDHDAFRKFHIFGNTLITFLINRLFGVHLTDVLSGYRAVNINFAKGIALTAKKYEIETELTIKSLENRFVVHEVDLPYKQRPTGSYSKLNTFSDGFFILATILRLFKDEKPLTFFGLFAGLFFVISIALQIYSVYPLESILFKVIAINLLTAGFILNSISQRAKENMQAIRKSSMLFNKDFTQLYKKEEIRE